MLNNVKVSIITVSFNSVKTIEQTIKSVINQTYKSIEYIIIDGASTDGTQQVIEKYKDRISFYVSEKDDGLYYAMNKGIEHASGDIVGIINSDDWYVEDAVENMVVCMLETDADLAYGKVVNINTDGREETIGYKPLEKIWCYGVIHHPSVFVKRKIYEKYGVFNTGYRIYSDYDLLLRFYSKGIRFEFNDKVIAYFRVGGLSTTQQYDAWNEPYTIAMSYIDKCPNRNEVEKIVNIEHQWSFLRKEIAVGSSELLGFFNRNFKKDKKKVIIFGTGIWSERCYKILSQSDVAVTCFADNNPSRWNTQFHDIHIINPSELKNMDAYVLIAVKEHGNEIKEQLNSMENDALKCVTINELMKMYWNRQ